MPRCALNLEEHGVRYAGLDRSAVGSRKYFTALALSKGVGLRLSGHSPSIIAFAAFEYDCRHRSAVPQRFIFWTTHPRNALGRHRLRLRLASGYSHGPHQNDNSIIRGDHTIFGMASPPNYPNFLDNGLGMLLSDDRAREGRSRRYSFIQKLTGFADAHPPCGGSPPGVWSPLH